MTWHAMESEGKERAWNKARHGKAWHGKAMIDMERKGKVWRVKERQGNARKGKDRHGNARKGLGIVLGLNMARNGNL
jgi:hypothetical protein